MTAALTTRTCLWLLVLLPTLTVALAPSVGRAQNKSLVIGVDGLRPDALEAARTTHIAGLIRGTFAPGYRGAYSPHAQAEEITISGPGHSSILTGVHPAKHGVTSNTIDMSTSPPGFVGGRFREYPDYFATIAIARPDLRSVRLVSWDGTAIGIPSGAGRTLLFSDDDAAMANAAAEILQGTHRDYPADPDVVFVFFGDTDVAGHEHGFSPLRPGYLDAIRAVDTHIGRVLHALKMRPTFANENWQIVLTSDHGGAIDGSHGGGTPEKRTVPFLIAAKNVGQGFLPGRPQIVDVAPTVLDHLGVALPACYDGRVQGPEVVGGDILADERKGERATMAGLLGGAFAVVFLGLSVRTALARLKSGPQRSPATAFPLHAARAERDSCSFSNS